MELLAFHLQIGYEFVVSPVMRAFQLFEGEAVFVVIIFIIVWQGSFSSFVFFDFLDGARVLWRHTQKVVTLTFAILETLQVRLEVL